MKSFSHKLELKSAIVRHPLIVSPDITVIDAITQMSGVRTTCDTIKTPTGQIDDVHLEARSSCVLVVEDRQLLGILTERDVVRLSAQQCPLEQLKIHEVMIHPVVTLQEKAFTDLLSAVNLLQQYKIRHLPIVDEQDCLVGLLTNESLGQNSRQVDLLRLRLVSEVMTQSVVCARAESSMLEVAQLMATRRVSSVLIVQDGGTAEQSYPLPLGIVTERDLVQFQALGLKLEKCLAHQVMSTPIFTVGLNDSLWTVQQIMEQHLIRRLAVTGSQGELLGIVTQTSLLQALNPMELYKLAEVLEKKLILLEDEKLQLLKTRTAQLEKQVESGATALQSQAERDQLANSIAIQIRSSLSLQTILENTVNQVRQHLGCDRVNIWQIQEDLTTSIVAESTDLPVSLMGQTIKDICFAQNCTELYRQGRIRIVSDIYTTEMQDCHRQMLIRLQTRAKILVPLLCGDRLWGLLNVTESQKAREWQPEEVELLRTLSIQLAIALQQATTHQKLQEELLERQHAEAKLQELTKTLEQRVEQRTAELQDREILLTESNRQLARATRLKDEFLANMSHELRTPLNAILGMTEGLQEKVFGDITSQQLKALCTIERSGSHLLELINDILDVAKIESGQIELDCKPTAIHSLCQSSLAFIKQQALKKRIQLQTKLPSNLPELCVDERRIRQVLINLLNNAVKFTPEGGCITLEVIELPLEFLSPALSTQPWIRLAIMDTGIGIASENIPKLFQPFVQIDSALNRQYAGTGLGLSLVKRIVELHGGTVGLTSKPGQGSCFTIDLPCVTFGNVLTPKATAAETMLAPISPSSTNSRHPRPLILMAEDNESNISTICSYLEPKGYQILIAKNGQEAVNFAEAHQPQLILMDVQMPGMDGLEATRQIRSKPNLSETPIIALTALAMAGDREKCLAAGANEYFSKPVKLKQLDATIQQLLAITAADKN